MNNIQLICECGHRFTANPGPYDSVVICPKCGSRIHHEQVKGTGGFILVPGVARILGPNAFIEGSLVVTSHSISFVGPAAEHTLTLVDPAVKYVEPKRNRSLLQSVLALITLAMFGATVFAVINNRYTEIFFILLPASTFLTAVCIIYDVMRMKRALMTRQLKQQTFIIPVGNDFDRFIDFRKGKRSLYEQISQSSDIEKKIRDLVKYRQNSIRMSKKAIRAVEYDGGLELTITGLKSQHTFLIRKQFREELNTALRQNQYIF